MNHFKGAEANYCMCPKNGKRLLIAMANTLIKILYVQPFIIYK